jgi:tripartite-type tricarboxylate transporter receptor subunit TctC
MIDRRSLIVGSLGAGVAANLTAGTRRAQAQVKTKGARMLVGFPPGGGPDIVGRLVAEELKGYASSIIVENHPGAGGRLALEALKNAEADGSVFAITPSDPVTLFPHVYRTMAYDPLRDFAPVTTLCTTSFLFLVGPVVPGRVKTIAQFIDWCRANPKLATYGSPGVGTLPHFLGASLAHKAGFEFVHSPYKGGVQAIQDFLAGQLAAAVFTVAAVLGHVRRGSLRALATTAPQRSAVLPDVPTIGEAGYPALEAVVWFGIVAPAATPAAIVASLNIFVRRTLESDAVKAGLAHQALDVAGCSPSEFSELMRVDTRRWGDLVKGSGFALLE